MNVKFAYTHDLTEEEADLIKRTALPIGLDQLTLARLHQVLSGTLESLKGHATKNVGFQTPIAFIMNHLCLLGNVLSRDGRIEVQFDADEAQPTDHQKEIDQLQAAMTELSMDLSIQTGIAKRRGEAVLKMNEFAIQVVQALHAFVSDAKQVLPEDVFATQFKQHVELLAPLEAKAKELGEISRSVRATMEYKPTGTIPAPQSLAE